LPAFAIKPTLSTIEPIVVELSQSNQTLLEKRDWPLLGHHRILNCARGHDSEQPSRLLTAEAPEAHWATIPSPASHP
jgi:hypothetical protein